MRTRIRVGVALLLGAFAVVAVVAYFGNQELYLTVDELAARMAPATPGGASEPLSLGQRLQVRGAVDTASIGPHRPGGAPSEQAGDLVLAFTLLGDNQRLQVVYRGLVPDTFAQAETITVGGFLDKSGTFQADTMTVQCPSKYQAAPPGALVTPRASGEPTGRPTVSR